MIAWTSRDTLVEAVERFKPTGLVRIYSPGRILYPVDGLPDVGLVFHDREACATTDFRTMLCCREQIEEFRTFASQTKRLLISCTAGLSRSPALAVVAAVDRGVDPAEACAAVAHSVPHAQPNRRVLLLADEIVGTSILSAAQTTFRYTRGSGRPEGARSGPVELDCWKKKKGPYRSFFFSAGTLLPEI